jgi:hypothetical protein
LSDLPSRRYDDRPRWECAKIVTEVVPMLDDEDDDDDGGGDVREDGSELTLL